MAFMTLSLVLSLSYLVRFEKDPTPSLLSWFPFYCLHISFPYLAVDSVQKSCRK